MQLRDIPEETIRYVLEKASDLSDAANTLSLLLNPSIRKQEIFSYLAEKKQQILEYQNNKLAQLEKKMLDQLISYDDVYTRFSNFRRSSAKMLHLSWDNLPETVRDYCIGKTIYVRHNLSIAPMILDPNQQFKFLQDLLFEDRIDFFIFFMSFYPNLNVLSSLHAKSILYFTPEALECIVERIAQLKYIENLKNTSHLAIKTDLSRHKLALLKLELENAIKQNTPKDAVIFRFWQNKTLQAYMFGQPIQFNDNTIEALTVNQQLKFLKLIVTSKSEAFFKLILRENYTNGIFVLLRNMLSQTNMHTKFVTIIDNKLQNHFIAANKYKNTIFFQRYISILFNSLGTDPFEDNLQLLQDADLRIAKYLVGETIKLNDHTQTAIPSLMQTNIFAKLLCPEYAFFVVNYISQINNMDILTLLRKIMTEVRATGLFSTAFKEREMHLLSQPVDHNVTIKNTVNNLISDLEQKSLRTNLTTLKMLDPHIAAYLVGDTVILKDRSTTKIPVKLQETFFKALLDHEYTASFDDFIRLVNDSEVLLLLRQLVSGYKHEAKLKETINARSDTLLDILLQKELLQANKNMKELEEFLLDMSNSTTPSFSTSTTSTSNYNNSNVMYPTALSTPQTPAKKRPFDEISTPTASKK